MKLSRRYFLLFIILLAGILIFLSFNRHSRAGEKNYHAQIWADKAGYYVYLPYLFIYGMDATHFPDSIEYKTGKGFYADRITGNINTKYTYGVALMQLPFFLITHLTTTLSEYDNDGFSLPYNKMLDIAGVFFLLFGLLFTYRFLKMYVSPKLAFISTTALLLCTNLFYYGIDETGMSHIYSFFWFAFFLYSFKRFLLSVKAGQPDILYIFYTSVASAAILIIRPFNGLFIFIIFLLDINTFTDFKNRLSLIFKNRYYRFFLFVISIAIIPQILFWSNTQGSPVAWTYQDEGFLYWKTPQFLKIWFSTNNGLFTYNPIWLLFVASIIFLTVKKSLNSVVLLFFFILFGYLMASWWSPELGCGFGNRAYVEYLPLFILGFSLMFKYLTEHSKRYFWIVGIMLLFFAVWNLKLTYSWDGCWYHGYWDWQEFFGILTGPAK